MHLKSSIILIVITFFFSLNLFGQLVNPEQPQTLIIAGMTVTGNKYSDAETILTLSGLRVGDQITLPSDQKLQTAMRSLWQRRQFSHIDIVVDRISPVGVFLEIKVEEFPRLNQINIENNKEISEKDIKESIKKVRGDIVTNYDIHIAESSVKQLYNKKGMSFAEAKGELVWTESANYVDMNFWIEEGSRFKIASIVFDGNENFSDSKLRGALKETKRKTIWRFWRNARYDERKFAEDKQLLLDFYRKEGHIDAQIVKDTVIFNEDERSIEIQVMVTEGDKIYVRDIKFEGNTIFPDELLIRRLEFEKGDPYDTERFNQNLFGNPSSTDAHSLYLDNGYLQSMLTPQERRVSADSVDIIVKVYENERYTIDKVKIVGNTKTKDKVIRRELYTRPGDYFDRSAIIRSVRALGVLQYFNPEKLRPDVQPSQHDRTAVDVIYNVEERSTDTFNASIGFAGSFGFTGAIGVTLNNFSIMEPLRGGGGQVFNLHYEMGQRSRYRTFSVGLSEPWLFDEPTTVGFNIFDTYYKFLSIDQRITGFRTNVGRRFKWPDDYFRGDWSFQYLINDNKAESFYYRQGRYSEITLGQAFSRISFNHPFFPSTGSKFKLSTNFAMGALGIGETDYLKNEFNFEMYAPLAQYENSDRLVLMLSTQFGYIDGVKTDTTLSQIELYRMGGNGLGGFNVTPLRGYPDNEIGPIGGAKVLSKYTSELRFAVTLDPMPVYVYAFAEAGNVWSNFGNADMFDLKRAAGVGVQMMVAPIGILGFSYGYGFDPVGVQKTKSGWQFLFHLGQ